jgi:hypothetical protein
MKIIEFKHDNTDDNFMISKNTPLFLGKNYKGEFVGKLQPVLAYMFDEEEIKKAENFLKENNARDIKFIPVQN